MLILAVTDTKSRTIQVWVLSLLACLMFVSATPVFAHGALDHHQSTQAAKLASIAESQLDVYLSPSHNVSVGCDSEASCLGFSNPGSPQSLQSARTHDDCLGDGCSPACLVETDDTVSRLWTRPHFFFCQYLNSNSRTTRIERPPRRA